MIQGFLPSSITFRDIKRQEKVRIPAKLERNYALKQPRNENVCEFPWCGFELDVVSITRRATKLLYARFRPSFRSAGRVLLRRALRK